MSPSPAEQLARDGYAVLPDLLDSDSVSALRAELSGTFECLQFPHLASECFVSALLRPDALALLRETIGPELKLAQSIVLMRPGGSPGLGWHQDRHYLEVQGALVDIWIALDDAWVENGCLEIVPGSHRPAEVRPHRNGMLVELRPESQECRWPLREAALALEVRAGTGVVYDGYLVHRSLDNRRRTGLRRALIGHFTMRGAASRWDGANRRAPVAGGAVEMVGGASAYAHPGPERPARYLAPRAQGA